MLSNDSASASDAKQLGIYNISLYSMTVSGKVQTCKLSCKASTLSVTFFWILCFLISYLYSVCLIYLCLTFCLKIFFFVILLSKLYFIFLYVGILCAIRRCLSRSSFLFETRELFRPIVEQIISHMSDLIELTLNIFGGRLTADSKLINIILFQTWIILHDLFTNYESVG